MMPLFPDNLYGCKIFVKTLIVIFNLVALYIYIIVHTSGTEMAVNGNGNYELLELPIVRCENNDHAAKRMIPDATRRSQMQSNNDSIC